LSRTSQKLTKPSPQFWLLTSFLILVFLTGGASRTDVQSLLILRPASVFMCALAMMTLRREHWVQHKWLLGGFLATAALAAVHLIPLPSGIWQALPGRGDAVAIEALVGLKDIWRPLTLTPMNGWHALASLATPLAILLFGAQLNREDLFRLLPVMIALGGLSGFFGLLQAIGSPDGPLYFYRITNNGSAVGLFANRNHAATLLACLLPMLAVFAATAKGAVDQQRSQQLLAAAIAIVLVPLILVTGSRSGLVSALLGLAGAVLVYHRPVEGRVVRRGTAGVQLGAAPILGGLAVICLGFLTFFFSRAEAIERLFAEASNEDNRTDFWLISLDLFWKYFPFGSGSGSFAEIFRIAEPSRMLDSTYLNHAHNDWLEIAVSFGAPGVLLLAIMTIAFLYRTFVIWTRMSRKSRSVTYSRMASIAIAIIAIASISDYPLRTPTMMSIMSILTLWFIQAGREPISGSQATEAGS
jgi:hypothetical protein